MAPKYRTFPRIIGLPTDPAPDPAEGSAAISDSIPQEFVPPEIEALVRAAREIEQGYQNEKQRNEELRGEIESVRAEVEEMKGRELSSESSPGNEPQTESQTEIEEVAYDNSAYDHIPDYTEISLMETDIDQVSQERDLWQHRCLNAEEKIQEQEERYREILAILQAEVENLREVFPLRGQLKAKQLEVQRLEKSLTKVSTAHPDRYVMESILRDQYDELRDLGEIVSGMEKRFEKQDLKIRDTVEQLESLRAAVQTRKDETRAGVPSPSPTPPPFRHRPRDNDL